MHLPRFMQKRNTENVVAYRGSVVAALNKERMM
jgi:hypothetical protein